jgi:hypothetical protein
MNHEFEQTEISAIQLRESKTQPKVSLSREIGVAEITHTIFGKAKVRIIRKHDKIRRKLMLAALLVAALAIAAWQSWLVSQQTEPLPGADPALALSAGAQEAAPASQSENIASLAIPPSAKIEPGTPPQAEINNPAINQKSALQPSSGLKGDEQMAAKPVEPRPLKATKSQSEPPVATENALNNPADLQPPAKPVPQKKKSVAASRIALSAASSPADVPVLSAPLGKEDISTPSFAENNQPTGSDNAPGK